MTADSRARCDRSRAIPAALGSTEHYAWPEALSISLAGDHAR
jgi:hypothetical protein